MSKIEGADDGTFTHVLHLEDSLLDAELLQAHLENSEIPFRFERVDDRAGFVRALETQSIDLILADYNLPGFNGLQAMNLARERFPEVPFIFVSGALGEELAVELLKGGATDYVLKNNLSRLDSVMQRAIGEKQALLQQRQAEEAVRKAKEEAEQANAAKSHFLSRISHELRTPLNAILGYAQLAQADPLSEEQQHCTIQIMKAGQHLLTLINEVLDISRIEAGQMQLRTEAVDAIGVIHKAVDLVKPMARDADVALYVDGGPCNRYIAGDSDRLAQVMINLISNAVKYNVRGGSVFVECQETGNGLKILVRDTGAGIASEKLARLFVPFDRLDADRSTTAQGTGLGLAVSKGLIEAMNGSIGVDNAVDKGCIFWVELPYADEEVVKSTVGSGDATLWREPTVREQVWNILMVEDNCVNADFMERVFRRRSQYCLASVSTGTQVMDFLENSKVDLLLADVNLPDMPGDKMVAEIKAKYPAMPILIVTAETGDEVEQRLRSAGADGLLTKPVNVGEMFYAIYSLLNPAESSPSIPGH